jgi:hypothetical protein
MVLGGAFSAFTAVGWASRSLQLGLSKVVREGTGKDKAWSIVSSAFGLAAWLASFNFYVHGPHSDSEKVDITTWAVVGVQAFFCDFGSSLIKLGGKQKHSNDEEWVNFVKADHDELWGLPAARVHEAEARLDRAAVRNKRILVATEVLGTIELLFSVCNIGLFIAESVLKYQELHEAAKEFEKTYEGEWDEWDTGLLLVQNLCSTVDGILAPFVYLFEKSPYSKGAYIATTGLMDVGGVATINAVRTGLNFTRDLVHKNI